jgi:hypothetical protein
MYKKFLLSIAFLSLFGRLNALSINEIFSNPIGDDSGREWVEIYNETDNPVDISSLTLSIKGGSPIVVTPVSGGTLIPSHGYGVIGSTVSGATRFLQDYPEYNGVLCKSSISLVNTGVTSIDIRLGGVVVDVVASYTAAKEGKSYAKVAGQFVTATPSPGKENTQDESTSSNDTQATTTGITGTQTTIPQMSPPSADITLYLPFERTVVAGAPTEFSVYALTGTGKPVSQISYLWAFGDGGQGAGSTTIYRYMYPGNYLVYVDGTTGLVAGKARMKVRVVQPDIAVSSIKSSAVGSYIEVTNPNPYELDISGWKLSVDGAMYSFPFTTVLLPGVTKISSQALGFASSTYTATSAVRLLFGDNTEVVTAKERKEVAGALSATATSSVIEISSTTKSSLVEKGSVRLVVRTSQQKLLKPQASSSATTSPVITIETTRRDNRIATFFRSLFK